MDRKSQLKNLMKKERQDRTQKIDSPLAKYNSAGQLLCILCQAPVQADALWDAHCKTKKHLEGLVALKQAKAAKQSGAVKRTASEVPSEDEQPVKRAKVTPLSQTPVPAPTPQAPEPEPESALVTYGEDEPEEQAEEEESGLDADTVAQLEREMMNEEAISQLIAQSRAAQGEEIEVEINLPEGFFDAQRAERAVKTVKQTPPPASTDTNADNEWDKFQASLPVTSDTVSNGRPDELEDDTRQEEDLDTEIENEIPNEELEQQQSLLSRLMEIKKKAAEQLSQPKKAVPKEVEASDEEDDVDPFDWRAKGF